MRKCFISFFSVLILIHSQTLGYEISFDCGGTGCTMDGTVFSADISYPGTQSAGYLDGSTCIANSNSITGGPFQPPSICGAYRRGDFSYQFDVPNGDYAVTLYFNEFQVHGPGLRQFPIIINRTVHHEDFDIWSRARMFYAFSVRLLVQVTDGTVVASFGSASESCVLAGISVKNIEDYGLVPEPPAGMTTTASYDAVNLSWDIPGDEVAGVKIYRDRKSVV